MENAIDVNKIITVMMVFVNNALLIQNTKKILKNAYVKMDLSLISKKKIV